MLKLFCKKILVVYLFFIIHQVNECETDVNLFINNLNFTGSLTFVVFTGGILIYNYIFTKSTAVNSLSELKESEIIPLDDAKSSFLSLTKKIDCDLSKEEQMSLFLELKKRIELIKQSEIEKKSILDVEPSISSAEDNLTLFNWVYNLFISIF